MQIFLSLLFTALFFFKSNAQTLLSPFETDSNQTATFEQCISFYKALDKKFQECKIIEMGNTDTGEPFRLVIIGRKNGLNADAAHKNHKLIFWINNGIHPGEPEGIDATMIFAREVLTNKIYNELLDKITLVIVPIYNVGGSKNRNSYSRANQDGPKEYGFRGNVQNLDLNRDFIKCDSRNAISFTKLFSAWNPHVFLETHTSDGADYPYTMTLLNTMSQKLGDPLAQLMNQTILPELYHQMKTMHDEMVPYVNIEDIPENGIYAFYDSPRFSTGYSALHHCMGFLSETHMLKAFPNRVQSTLRLEKIFLVTLAKNSQEIIQAKKENSIRCLQEKTYPLHWKYELERADSMDFLCYEPEYPISEISGKSRLKYNRNKVTNKRIALYNSFKPDKTIEIPDYYIVPQGYEMVYKRLKWNGVTMQRLQKDSVIHSTFYKIDSFKTTSTPYENHYLHSQAHMSQVSMAKPFFKGDWIISTKQDARKYIVESLEPEGPDSFFNWNFFDGILMRKEYFSDYVFEDIALQLLAEDKDLREKFENKKKTDKNFKDSPAKQLEFIYIHSKFAENYYNIYPVARIFN